MHSTTSVLPATVTVTVWSDPVIEPTDFRSTIPTPRPSGARSSDRPAFSSSGASLRPQHRTPPA
jgi:hypothetical protein